MKYIFSSIIKFDSSVSKKFLKCLIIFFYISLFILFNTFHPIEKIIENNYSLPNIFSVSWKDTLIYIIMVIFIRELWAIFIYKNNYIKNKQKVEVKIYSGHIHHMPFIFRFICVTIFLFLVLIGEWSWYHSRQSSHTLLWISGFFFLIFLLQEMAILLMPGDTFIPNRSDELSVFLSGRVLRIGYVFSIGGLIGVLLLTLFLPTFLAPILPLLLTICVFTPAFRLYLYERQANVS